MWQCVQQVKHEHRHRAFLFISSFFLHLSGLLRTQRHEHTQACIYSRGSFSQDWKIITPIRYRSTVIAAILPFSCVGMTQSPGTQLVIKWEKWMLTIMTIWIHSRKHKIVPFIYFLIKKVLQYYLNEFKATGWLKKKKMARYNGSDDLKYKSL